MSKHLERRARESPEWLADRRVIELGAGCGLVGISAALLGARVILTDRAEVMASLDANVALNAPFACTPRVAALDWTDRASPLLSEHFDYVLAADVVWVIELIDPLVATFSGAPLAMALHARLPRSLAPRWTDLIRDGTTVGLLAYQSRSSRADDALAAAVERHGLHMRRCDPDRVFDGRFRRDVIDLFEVTRSVG